ncbi:prolyl oligopeptidase family serine peptidase [Kocuria carniphila]|uniref:prolyl oligopeptidase family serine peptidase n=1 Tax=Kocuria carniphila TaxID=262208 RepID=UPI0021A3FA4A|nr:prolyl oligopeptidase family serine peptidase [Kocuria carniphila]MCT1803082.1 prolyl oligopeptidase family serine peptidase [Kocuria carniphila]
MVPTTPSPTHLEDELVDEFLWLEDIHGERPKEWVQEQNQRTETLLDGPELASMTERVLGVMDNPSRIAAVTKHGPHYYNFWRDAQHPRGLWRRTTWESWLSDSPDWDVLLDVDELARTENVDWVFSGARLLRPRYTDGQWQRALVRLSPDGGDAVRTREFDLGTQEFVAGGFDVPTAKSSVSWVDADTLFVATDTGPGSMTESSYPRQVRRVSRGQSITDAPVIFEVPVDHAQAAVYKDHTPGFERVVAMDLVEFFTVRTYLWSEEQWVELDLDPTVSVDLHNQWLLIRPRHTLELNGIEYPAGCLLAADVQAFLNGDRSVQSVFTPDKHSSLEGWSWARDHLILNTLHDVSSALYSTVPGEWELTALPGIPPLHSASAWAVDDEDAKVGNDYFFSVTGFLTPSSLGRGSLPDLSGPDADGAADSTARKASEPAALKRAPSFFDAQGLEVTQHFAVSADGTRVPYFQAGPCELELDGLNPTLLSGYGGFEVSRTPGYSGATGITWLTREDQRGRTGVCVIANIRGGGEYGPSWHTAALKQNRHRAYEDFAAVAKDLHRRGVCTARNLACAGGSNGGLLVGNMLTTYPDLFGAISCGVPLLDMRRYTKLSAGASWIAEYGDPEQPEQWEYIRTFSPYHLLSPVMCYPPALIWTATSDDRVGPVQARKMAAKMLDQGHQNVWFHEATDGGHAGASDNRQAAALHARSHEFMWQMLENPKGR